MRLLNATLLRILTGWYGLRAWAQYEEGQTLAEYGLILTLIAVAVIIPTTLILRNQMSSAFTAAVSCLAGSC